MFNFSRARLELGFARIEKQYLNRLGYWPIVCNFSGELRHYYGIAQIIVFLSLALFNTIRLLFTPERQDRQSLIDQTVSILDYVLHGALNVIRAQLESFPATLYLYDKVNFRVGYLSEVSETATVQ